MKFGVFVGPTDVAIDQGERGDRETATIPRAMFVRLGGRLAPGTHADVELKLVEPVTTIVAHDCGRGFLLGQNCAECYQRKSSRPVRVFTLKHLCDALNAVLGRGAAPERAPWYSTCDGCGQYALCRILTPTLDGTPTYNLCATCIHNAARHEQLPGRVSEAQEGKPSET